MSKNMGLLGRKLGTTQIFSESGTRIAVTAVEAGPCLVMGTRTVERDGYQAILLGFEDRPLRLVSKPVMGTLAKAGLRPKRFVRELRLETAPDAVVGAELKPGDVFKVGDFVDVTGTNKGKGYQGVMKRHHFSGFRHSHGVHEFFRHGGSIGCRLTPGRVHKGKRMAGQMGNRRRTVQNLKVVDILEDRSVLLIEGAVPGGKNGLVVVRSAVKKPRPSA